MNVDQENLVAPARCLIVGVGSPHGDDRAGWSAIDQLKILPAAHCELRKAAVPHDLIDWLSGIDSSHIIDSCICETDHGDPQRFELRAEDSCNPSRWQWTPSPQISPGIVATVERSLRLRSAGSHQIDLVTVLELAACLNRLPKKIVLWAIPGYRFAPGEDLTQRCERAVQECVRQLVEELGNA